MAETVYCVFDNVDDDGTYITYKCPVCKRELKVGDVAPPTDKVCRVGTRQQRAAEKEAAKQK